jgi:hypothetical protein
VTLSVIVLPTTTLAVAVPERLGEALATVEAAEQAESSGECSLSPV